MPIYLPASGGEIKDYRQASKTKIPSLHTRMLGQDQNQILRCHPA